MTCRAVERARAGYAPGFPSRFRCSILTTTTMYDSWSRVQPPSHVTTQSPSDY